MEGTNMPDFELSDEILSVIPNDPFEQLDLAKKITSMAIASRVSNLEAEVIELNQKLHEKDIGMHELERKTYFLERDLQETDSRLKIVLDDNMNLKKERDALAITVKNLSHDMAKLETFKRQLIQSLSDENAPKTEPVDVKTCDHMVPGSYSDKEQRKNVHLFRHSHSKSVDSTFEEAPMYTGPRFSVTPYMSTWNTPTRTPKITSPRSSASGSSSRKRTSGTLSPSNTYSERKERFWYPSSQQSSAANSPPRGLPIPARSPRSDGKEFFSQARNRLSYEQFKAFLANIKDLNARKQTREETLRKADEIFGTENKDLYMSFQGLVTKNKN